MPVSALAPPGMIYLPETMKKWPWARAINPYYEEVFAQSKADFHTLKPFNTASQYAFDKCDFGRLASLAYPHASKEHLRVGCDLMNVFFIIDEYTDVENVPMVREMIDIVIDALEHPHKKRPEGEVVLGEVVRRFWELTLKSATPNVARHFLDAFNDYLESVVEQAEDRESDTPLTVDGYLKMRRRNIGIRPSFMPAELGLTLPDEVFYHPVVQELQYLIAELVFLDNDMVSYNKEQATGNSCHNILTVAMREFNIDLQAALGWLYEHHAQVQVRFFGALERVPSFGPQVDPQLEQYISRMAIWPRCNDSWNFESGRYFGAKGLEIQKSRWVPLLPKVERDPKLRADNVRVLLVEL
ncbi:isoprenoid synthase domain-containing protein [Mycena polygramma]|nr:isoprenoid synthase domain-containing protein [Mycena polygramma]